MSMILPKPPAVPGLVLGTTPTTPIWGDVAWRSPGATNLLTRNQASVEDGNTAGFTSTTFTLAASTAQAAQGSFSLSCTANGTQSCSVYTSTGGAGVPVVGGRLYTAVMSMRSASVTTGAPTMYIYWYKADGTSTSPSQTSVTVQPVTSTAWVEQRIAAVAPADAAFASPRVGMALTAGDVLYVDKVGFWEGPGGTWAMPGEPIQGIGTYWDETVGRRQFAWDTVNSRWQMVYGDTGWRTLTPENGWSASILQARRRNDRVSVVTTNLTGAGASSSVLWTPPSGWYPKRTVSASVPLDGSSVTHARVDFSPTPYVRTDRTVMVAGSWELSWSTADAWPATLPGTADGSIPYN